MVMVVRVFVFIVVTGFWSVVGLFVFGVVQPCSAASFCKVSFWAVV